MKKVAVVILNWNKAQQTQRCLEIARRTTPISAHWIVVDNGSTEPMNILGDDVTLLRNEENLGFAGGVNTGLRHAFTAGVDYAWLLNNDTEPLPGALDALLAVAQADPAIGLASPVILNADANDEIEFHGGLWGNGDYRTTSKPAEYARWLAASPNQIWLLGTALLVSRQLVERVGYLDETLFAYWEDNEISRRSAAAGFHNVVVPEARVRHESGHPAQNPAERPPYYYYFMTRNELLLLRKTGDLAKLRPIYWALCRAVRLYKRLASLPAQRQAVRRGMLDGLLGRGGAYRG